MTKVPKYRKQKNMAQQMKAILIILMVVLAVYAGVSAMLLGRTRKQAIQEMDEMSKLYTDELDNRFLRISRSLFSNIMEKNQGYSVLGDYIETMEHSDDPVKNKQCSQQSAEDLPALCMGIRHRIPLFPVSEGK